MRAVGCVGHVMLLLGPVVEQEKAGAGVGAEAEVGVPKLSKEGTQALRRCWCLWEVFCAVESKCKLQVKNKNGSLPVLWIPEVIPAAHKCKLCRSASQRAGRVRSSPPTSTRQTAMR